ncbi:MAG: hypothetical protein KDB80_04180, partial [Planctomycetes bacterium]|nr:hypothetical protein [Planctomycetota bacterium]
MRQIGFWAILLGAIVLYGPALDGGLIWDDIGYVYFSAQCETVEWWKSVAFFLWGSREAYPMGTYRPVLELTYVFEYRLWGVEALGYRVTNLLLHIGSSLMLVAVARRLGMTRFAAWTAGVLFAVSPAHPESCLWLSCRVNLLAAFCMLGAVRSHLAGHRVRGLIWALFAFGSKETAYVLPPLLAWWSWWSADASGFRARSFAALRSTAALWVALGLVISMRYHTLGELVGGYAWREPPPFVSWTYLRERLDLLLVTFAPVNL